MRQALTESTDVGEITRPLDQESQEASDRGYDELEGKIDSDE
jgi:hypothetical protein